MSSPTETDRLRPSEIDHLGTAITDLIADRDDGVAYPTESARQAADVFAGALHDEPLATLRALQLALQRLRLDLREDGHEGRRAAR